MRWDAQRIDVDDGSALPGMPTPLVAVRDPETFTAFVEAARKATA